MPRKTARKPVTLAPLDRLTKALSGAEDGPTRERLAKAPHLVVVEGAAQSIGPGKVEPRATVMDDGWSIAKRALEARHRRRPFAHRVDLIIAAGDQYAFDSELAGRVLSARSPDYLREVRGSHCDMPEARADARARVDRASALLKAMALECYTVVDEIVVNGRGLVDLGREISGYRDNKLAGAIALQTLGLALGKLSGLYDIREPRHAMKRAGEKWAPEVNDADRVYFPGALGLTRSTE